jgi:hypothetical protein
MLARIQNRALVKTEEINQPFVLSGVSRTAGALPDPPLEGPGLEDSARSIFEGCETPLLLGTALLWLSAGDFVCVDGVSATLGGTLDFVTVA